MPVFTHKQRFRLDYITGGVGLSYILCVRALFISFALCCHFVSAAVRLFGVGLSLHRRSIPSFHYAIRICYAAWNSAFTHLSSITAMSKNKSKENDSEIDIVTKSFHTIQNLEVESENQRVREGKKSN